jgi:acyl-coenzyme A synthetase/AMP-(fatty) acid ligase
MWKDESEKVVLIELQVSLDPVSRATLMSTQLHAPAHRHIRHWQASTAHLPSDNAKFAHVIQDRSPNQLPEALLVYLRMITVAFATLTATSNLGGIPLVNFSAASPVALTATLDT